MLWLLALAPGLSAAGTIIDNTDTGFTIVGNWPVSTGVPGFYGSDYQYTNKGDGSRTAHWQFNIGSAGDYDVAAQWAAHSNRATNAPYTLYNNGVFVASVTANQQINGGQFNPLGTYTLAAGTLEIVLDNAADGFVVADAIQVTFLGVSNLPPDGTIDTPAADVTIMTGESVNFTGSYSDPEGDLVAAYLWTFGTGSGVADATVEDPGPVQFDSPGSFTVRFTVTDSNGASDPTPGQVTVTVNAPPGSGTIIDNTDAGFSTVGNWPVSTGVPGFYGSNYQYTNKGDGSRTANWQFNVGSAGDYDVAAQWAAHPNRATNAPYSLYNNGILIGTVTANQQTGGGLFNLLGTFTLAAGTLEVVLDNNASGYVVADAVQLVFTGIVGNLPPDGTIDTPTGDITVTVGDFIDFTGTYADPDGDPAAAYLWTFGTGSGLTDSNVEDPGLLQFNSTGIFTVTFTVTDSNGEPDPTPAQLTVTVTLPGGNMPPNGTIDTPTGNVTITAGGTVNFTGSYSDPDGDPALDYLWDFGSGSGVASSSAQDPGLVQFDNAGIFTVTFTVTDINSGIDPSPAQVTVTVTSLGSGIIMDNTDAGFSVTGSWPASTGVSGFYGADYQYTNKGDGSRTATWDISIGSAGNYDIEARWAAHTNRANNAPYTLYNNGVFVASVTANQQINGGQFNLLGSYSLVAGTLEIVLDNNASGFVVADAVRVIQTGAPQLTIVSPADNTLVSSDFMSVNAQVNNNPPGWGVEFVLNGDPATSVIDYSAPFENTFLSLLAAEYNVDAYLVDESGVRQPGFTKSTGFGVGDYHIAFGDSITRGLSDDLGSDDTSNDGRNTGGGYEPILNNLLTTKSGYPQTVINAGVSGDKSSTGLVRLPDVLGANPEANHVLILLGTNDAFFTGLASGAGLLPGQPGYAGSYKDNMQQIISTVVAAGKLPVLAKVLIIQPPEDPANPLVQEYNTVIDELILSNGITFVPPDFYTYFASNPGLYADNLHPNGNGYIDMANLWSDSFTY